MTQHIDNELMLMVKRGDLHKLGDLYERHNAKLFAYFLRFCGNRYQSEDMLQDTFTRVLQYAGSYKDNGIFIVWMFRIARNVIADYLRKEKVRTKPEDYDLDSFEALSPDPEYIEEVGQLERNLQLALLQLSAENRHLILLSKVKQFSRRDLASIFECSESAVKVRLHRAIKLLRESYDKQLNSIRFIKNGEKNEM